jgi:cysteinyl-tRNA synthetase
MNVLEPDIIVFASDHIKEEAAMIKKLMDKGYAYKTSDGIYFEVAKFPNYFKLSGRSGSTDEIEESRIEVNKEKKSPRDFVLWKFADKNGIGFDSELGKGFPGWHIECSAMSIKYLGEQFDIHTGGIDHIPIHHTNELAQSEAATGKSPFVRYWMHNNFLDIASGGKMAKSGENFLTLGTVREHGIESLAYRFWLLMAHYRTKVNFNWEALQASETALKRLYAMYLDLGDVKPSEVNADYQNKFRDYVEDDLDTPRAIPLLWEIFKDESVHAADKKATVLDFDKVLGLGFADLKKEEVPEKIIMLANEREVARKNKDFKKSDELRDKINSLGYEVKDTPEGPKVYKI